MEQSYPLPEKDYVVVIRCITFNQSKYIEETLKGFVMQKTNFPFVAIVIDDCSTDGNQEIIRKYEINYPEIIKGIYLTENHYSQKKSKLPYINPWRARAKYEALCEGDDYWTNPNKLQMQVDFLEANPNYGLCYGIVRQYNQEKKAFLTNRGADYISFERLLHKNPIPTLSVCYRLDMYNQYRSEIDVPSMHWKMGDYPTWLWFAYHSKLKFFPEIMGVYRIQKSSFAHFTNIDKQIEFYKAGWDVANFFSQRYLGKDLPTYKEYYERARLLSTKAHDRKAAYKEYKKIPNKNLKYRVLTILHSNLLTYHILALYYRYRYKQ